MRLWPRSKKEKQENKITTKDRIKESTYELLAEKGYASISTREISKRANAAVGQLTYYYRTKESLILEVVKDLLDNITFSLKKVLEKSTNKVISIQDFLEELIEEKETCKILVNVISQSLYTKKLKNLVSSFLQEVLNTIIDAYKEQNCKENDTDAKDKAIKLIDAFVGKILRENMQVSV